MTKVLLRGFNAFMARPDLLWIVCLVGVMPLFSQTVISPGANIQTAVDNAAAGSTLLLNAGTYVIARAVVDRQRQLRSAAIRQDPGRYCRRPRERLSPSVSCKQCEVGIVRITGACGDVFAGSGSTVFEHHG